MSYMTTTMFALLTLGSDQEMRAAKRAGWRRADLAWERASEAANEALVTGDQAKAIRGFRGAHLLARVYFSRTDPRYATSLANTAIAASLAGKRRDGTRKLAKAMALWDEVPSRLEAIKISPRARSSLFHLRMEARHWDTYCDNMRKRLGLFVAETSQALADLAEDRPTHQRLFSRWRGEKPNVFDDTRIYLAASLLLAGEQLHENKGD